MLDIFHQVPEIHHGTFNPFSHLRLEQTKIYLIYGLLHLPYVRAAEEVK